MFNCHAGCCSKERMDEVAAQRPVRWRLHHPGRLDGDLNWDEGRGKWSESGCVWKRDQVC